MKDHGIVLVFSSHKHENYPLRDMTHFQTHPSTVCESVTQTWVYQSCEKKKMWLKRLHKRSPSHHHFYAWYVCLPFPWLPQNVSKSTSKKYGTSDTSLLALLNVQNQARQAMNSPKICMADLGCPKPVSKIAIFHWLAETSPYWVALN